MSTSTDSATLTTHEAARYLGIGRTTLYQLIKSGELDSFLIGRRRLIPRQAIDRMVETLRQP